MICLRQMWARLEKGCRSAKRLHGEFRRRSGHSVDATKTTQMARSRKSPYGGFEVNIRTSVWEEPQRL